MDYIICVGKMHKHEFLTKVKNVITSKYGREQFDLLIPDIRKAYTILFESDKPIYKCSFPHANEYFRNVFENKNIIMLYNSYNSPDTYINVGNPKFLNKILKTIGILDIWQLMESENENKK